MRWGTYWDSVPGQLFEFIEFYDVGSEDVFVLFLALLG